MVVDSFFVMIFSAIGDFLEQKFDEKKKKMRKCFSDDTEIWATSFSNNFGLRNAIPWTISVQETQFLEAKSFEEFIACNFSSNSVNIIRE